MFFYCMHILFGCLIHQLSLVCSQTSLIALEGPPGATWHPQQERKPWGAEGGKRGVKTSHQFTPKTTAWRDRSLHLNTYFTLTAQCHSFILAILKINWSIHSTHSTRPGLTSNTMCAIFIYHTTPL